MCSRIFLIIGYSRRISNYLKRIALSNMTHVVSMADHMTIGVETPRIDSGWSLEKEFINLIHMNPWIVLCQNVNQVDSCHGCVCGILNWDTKDILWMNDRVLTVTYKSLAIGSLKHHRLHTTWSSWRSLSSQDGIICPWYKKRLIQRMRYN